MDLGQGRNHRTQLAVAQAGALDALAVAQSVALALAVAQSVGLAVVAVAAAPFSLKASLAAAQPGPVGPSPEHSTHWLASPVGLWRKRMKSEKCPELIHSSIAVGFRSSHSQSQSQFPVQSQSQLQQRFKQKHFKL